ncbi:MAG: hypothetical protein ACOCVF_00985 [bacterium]
MVTLNAYLILSQNRIVVSNHHVNDDDYWLLMNIQGNEYEQVKTLINIFV